MKFFKKLYFRWACGIDVKFGKNLLKTPAPELLKNLIEQKRITNKDIEK